MSDLRQLDAPTAQIAGLETVPQDGDRRSFRSNVRILVVTLDGQRDDSELFTYDAAGPPARIAPAALDL
jgi:hypothetical protein